MSRFERAVIALSLCNALALSALAYSFWHPCPVCGPAKYSLGLERDPGRVLPFTGYPVEILNRFECLMRDGKQCPLDAEIHSIDEPPTSALVALGLFVLVARSL